MTILISRTWSLDKGSTATPHYEGRHPHFIGRGSGSAFEWVSGYPSGYALLEEAVCSLDEHPEEFLPELHVSAGNPRRWIEV